MESLSKDDKQPRTTERQETTQQTHRTEDNNNKDLFDTQ